MRMHTRFALLGAAGLLVLLTAAPSAQNGYDLFQKALAAERASGNLQQAIELYQRVAREFASDRALAARALVRMADCYAKLGNAQARAIYERVTREYPEQTAAVQEARTHLQAEGLQRTSTRGDRLVWGPAPEVDLFGTISPDGRYLTYVDWLGATNVVVRDLVAGTDRPLTNNTQNGEHGEAGFSVISRSGDQVVYDWCPAPYPSAVCELRIVPFDGSAANSRLLRASNGHEGVGRPFDWSPDGRWIALLIERQDQSSQLAVVNARSGELRVLKSIDWRGVNKAVFSPDGRYLAYDLLEGEGVRTQRVWVMAVDGSREAAVTPASTTNALMGWTADGRLLFASDRSGRVGLWAMRVEDGRPRDVPLLVKRDLSSTWSLGLTRSGALYVYKPAGASYVTVADFDATAGEIRQSATPMFQAFVDSRGRPAWAPDGERLLYISCKDGASNCRIFIRDMQKGTTREVPHNLSYVFFPRFGPDGNTLITQGTDLKGRRAVYLIDATSGSTKFITDIAPNWVDWWPDGRSIYYGKQGPNEPLVLFRREIASNVEAEIFRTSACKTFAFATVRVSPDGHSIACAQGDPSTRTVALMVLPLDGGAPKALLRTREPGVFSSWRWMPDGRSILAQKRVPGGTDELWLAPLDGEPHRLSVDLRNWGGDGGDFDLSPDGQRIAFVALAGAHGAEVWALEHFLPPTGGTR
jgi:Tol biopolymer transport system component